MHVHYYLTYCHHLNLFQGTAIRDRIQERLRGQQFLLQNGKDNKDGDDKEYYYEDDSDEEYYEEYYDDEELNPQNNERDVKLQ